MILCDLFNTLGSWILFTLGLLWPVSGRIQSTALMLDGLLCYSWIFKVSIFILRAVWEPDRAIN